MKEKFLGYIKENYLEILIISTITLIAFILRFIALKNYGDLWLDELYSWYFASQKTVFGTVFELIKQDLHMPLYFIILHFWMKIFGKSDISMHICTLAVTIPLIPVSFYLMKNLYNKMTGYFAAIMFAISAFCIYYSIEVRFYGLVFVLTLISAFYFVKMLEENFDKKYTIGFLISHSLLLYTFSITPLLTFCYALVGGVYIFENKKDLLQEYKRNFLILAAIALPSIIFTIYNVVVMKFVNLCSFSKDIYVFDWNIITDILENYFTNETFQIVTKKIDVYRNMFELIGNSNYYILLVLVPILICLCGLIKCLLSRNNKLYLFLLPAFLFLICEILLAVFGVQTILTKYTAIIYPLVICSCCYGFSQIKFKPISLSLFVILIILNCSYSFILKNNVYNLNSKHLGNLTDVMNNIIKPKDDDFILIPYSGSKVMRYIPKGKYIDFSADDALLLKDKNSRAFYFDDKYYKQLNRKNIKDELRYDVIEKTPFILYAIRLEDFYFSKMKRGQRFILISFRNSFTMPLIQQWDILKNSEAYNDVNMFIFLMSKITLDSIQLCERNLKFINAYTDKERDYSIFVYEKQ